MSKTNYWETAILNLLRGTNVTAPATVYVGLLSAVTDAEVPTVTELTGGSYARVAVTFGAPANGTGTEMKVANTNDVVFPTATADWAQAVAFGIFDAATAGNMLYENTLTTAKTVLTGDSAHFPVGSLTVTED